MVLTFTHRHLGRAYLLYLLFQGHFEGLDARAVLFNNTDKLALSFNVCADRDWVYDPLDVLVQRLYTDLDGIEIIARDFPLLLLQLFLSQSLQFLLLLSEFRFCP